MSTSEAIVIIETPQLNRFQMVLLAARRAKEIINGSEPMIVSRRHKATTLALEEALAGKISLSDVPMEVVPERHEEAPEILTPIEHAKEGDAGVAGDTDPA